MSIATVTATTMPLQLPVLPIKMDLYKKTGRGEPVTLEKHKRPTGSGI